MKRFLSFIIALTFIHNISAQEYIYLDFFGVEDSSSKTHLVYRKHFTEHNRSYFKLNLETNDEIKIVEDLQQPTALDKSYIGENVTDIKFLPYSVDNFLYCGQSISAYEVGGYISNADSMIFGSFWNIPHKIFFSHQDTDNLFASTIFGEYFFSENGGVTWSVDQNYPADTDSVVNFNLISLSPFDANIMFGVDKNGLIKSENKGADYTTVDNSDWDYQETDFFYDKNETNIYARTKSNEEYKLFISDNFGDLNSWMNLIASSVEIIFCIDDSTSGELYYSTNKTINQSTDYGNSFKPIQELDFRITGLYKKPESNLLYISTYYKIYELNLTTDELKLIRTIDDFNPSKYYPLQLGNTWIYRTHGWDSSPHNSFDYEYKKIVRGDTTMDNGHKYYIVEEQSKKYFERYDSTETKVWMYYQYSDANENQEFLSYDLTTVQGDIINALFSDYYFDISLDFEHIDDSTKFIFDDLRHVKYYQAYNYDVQLAKGIGIVEKNEAWDYGIRNTKLKGCVINGVVYGDTSLVVSVEDEENLPNNFSLSQNYPNPFNPTTKIKFAIPTSPSPSPYQGEGDRVRLVVYDILGREVTTLINKPMRPGEYEVEFDASNLSSGIYFYRLTANEFVQTRKMLLLR